MLELSVSLRRFPSQPPRGGDRDATAVEYGRMVALVAAVLVGVVTLLGGNLGIMFSSVGHAL
jgi:pilus assembly protein Flp/PilA